MKARRVIAACGLVAVLAVTALWLSNGEEAPTKPMAYVVCGGNQSISKSRAYRVDLLTGELKGVSEPIDWLGQPWHLAYDPVHSRLYIASMHKMWSNMWPVTALWAHGGEFKVVNRFSTIRENNVLVQASAEEAPPTRSKEAYSVLVSPDGNELYVSYGGLLKRTGMLEEVWNANTGEVLRGLSASIDRKYEWSPDGNHVAVIWPSYEYEVNRDGKVTTKTWPGGVVIISTRTGDQSTLRRFEENKDLHPPWGRIDEPYIHFFPDNTSLGDLRIFDRDSGEMISRLQISQLTGLKVGGNPEVAALDGGRLIAVSTVKSTRVEPPSRYYMGSVVEQGYVLLIDVMDQREITRTRVGERCTNVVVAYEEIEQGA